MGLYDGTYTSTVAGLSGADGDLVISNDASNFTYAGVAFTPKNSNPGASLKFQVTLNGVTYHFDGAFSQGTNKQYNGSCNDNNSPTLTSGTWNAKT